VLHGVYTEHSVHSGLFPPFRIGAERGIPKAMGHWLVKQEPTTYSWSQFVSDGKTDWTGIRNFQARNFLRSMKVGDQVFFYHSVNGKSVVGIAAVSREAFPDPTAVEGDWSAVELKPVRPVTPPVSLGQIKQDSQLRDIPLLKQSRLSVMPLSTEQFNRILQISAGS
jgi:predicted RNA-binding protein with PUA-like domain